MIFHLLKEIDRFGKLNRLLACLFTSLLLVSCGGGGGDYSEPLIEEASTNSTEQNNAVNTDTETNTDENSQNIIEGQSNYEILCASCHASDGSGTSIGSSLIACETCSDISTLANIIETTMPYGNSGQCTSSCATNTAEYILSSFNENLLDTVTEVIDLPETPVSEDDQETIIDQPILEITVPDENVPTGFEEYEAMCASCHGSDGNGTSTGSSLIGCATCSNFSDLKTHIELTMPLGNSDLCIDQCANDTSEYILQAFNSTADIPEEVAPATPGLESHTLTLRRASLQFAKRLPSPDELDYVTQEGEEALSHRLDDIMSEAPFYNKLEEIFNKQFLTNKFLTTNTVAGGVNLLSPNDYPNRAWYNQTYNRNTHNDMRVCVRNITNDSIVKAPLKLVRYAAENDLPHTLFVNADFIMVNWYSQQSYDAQLLDSNAGFRSLIEPVCDKNGLQLYYDPDHYLPARINHDLAFKTDGLDHAGILTSTIFLNRYSTTDTNRNRHRAKVVLDYLLDTDILQIDGGIPDNIDNDGTPTLTNPSCTNCHDSLDPIASSFQNWTSTGRFIPADTNHLNPWDHSTIKAPGFLGQEMEDFNPNQGNNMLLQWLGSEIANNPRFARATVRTLYEGIFKESLLTTPNDNASDEEKAAFNVQRAIINEASEALVANHWSIKAAVKSLILSPIYRASDAVDTSAEYQPYYGASRFLSPEDLQNKLQATLGFGWSDFRNKFNRILFGGMNSDSITEEFQDPNGIILSMQERMAISMACKVTAYDFNLPANERRLFPNLEYDILPTSQDNIDLIRKTMADLHWSLLGEELSPNSNEVSETFSLYQELLETGQTLLLDQEAYDPNPWKTLKLACQAKWERNPDGTIAEEYPEGQRLVMDTSYNIRAWMGVLTYMLSDYRFIYE